MQQRWSLIAQSHRTGSVCGWHRSILKIGVSNPELTTEIETFRVYDGRGSVKPLNVDRDQGRAVSDRESDAPS